MKELRVQLLKRIEEKILKIEENVDLLSGWRIINFGGVQNDLLFFKLILSLYIHILDYSP
jgi:hypothetical protein